MRFVEVVHHDLGLEPDMVSVCVAFLSQFGPESNTRQIDSRQTFPQNPPNRYALDGSCPWLELVANPCCQIPVKYPSKTCHGPTMPRRVRTSSVSGPRRHHEGE